MHSSSTAAEAAHATTLSAEADGCAGLEVVPRSDSRRADLERFIAAAFSRAYGARVEHFADQLVGVRRPLADWAAGVGYTPAGNQRLFIEQYLVCPIEDAIAERLGVRVDRTQIVEVGNLAATTPGAARRLIVRMTALLHRLGHTWVVFTSTRALLNAFARLGIAPIELATADPRRLEGGADQWGSYYDTHPQVMTSSIPLGFIHFLSASTHAPSL